MNRRTFFALLLAVPAALVAPVASTTPACHSTPHLLDSKLTEYAFAIANYAVGGPGGEYDGVVADWVFNRVKKGMNYWCWVDPQESREHIMFRGRHLFRDTHSLTISATWPR